MNIYLHKYWISHSIGEAKYDNKYHVSYIINIGSSVDIELIGTMLDYRLCCNGLIYQYTKPYWNNGKPLAKKLLKELHITKY
jgi:hypothetical protein